MNTVSYQYPAPTSEQASRAYDIAVRVMDWHPTTTLDGFSYGYNRPYVYAHPKAGVLKGTPFYVGQSRDKGAIYDRSFQAWNPYADPAAADELRQALRAKGWRCAFSEAHEPGTTMPWLCRLTPDDTSRYRYASGFTSHEALCEAAWQVLLGEEGAA